MASTTAVNRIADVKPSTNGHAKKAEAKEVEPVKKAGPKGVKVEISKPNMVVGVFTIRGITPYVGNKFSQKAQNKIQATQEAGSTARKGSKREGKDFDEVYQGARHIGRSGKDGMPASAFRAAMISACRTVGFTMTLAKLAVFCIADDYDREDGTPLVLFTKGKPSMHIGPARNDNGSIDLRARPMWEPEWEAKVKLRFDADILTMTDVANLMSRVGLQVGIGEGRPDSKNSAGCGWGQFELVGV